MKNHNFRNLKVWQISMDMVKEVYQNTAAFPKEEIFGLTSQICRCAVSVPSNIAEGSAKSSQKDFARFLEISLGSSCELETQLILACELKMLTQEKLDVLVIKLHEVQKMLTGLSKSLTSNS